MLQIPEVETGSKILSKWHLVKGQIFVGGGGEAVGERLNNSKEGSDQASREMF